MGGNRRARKPSQTARIALRLRDETTMTWDWIAEELAIGVGAHVAHCVRVLKARNEKMVIRD